MNTRVASVQQESWVKKVVQPLYQKHVKSGTMSTYELVKQYDLPAKFEQKFKRSKSKGSMEYLIERLLNRKEHLQREKEKRMMKETNGFTKNKPGKSLKVLLKSDYILVSPPEHIMGFPTKEALLEFIKTSQLLGGLKLFVAKPITIDYNIKID